MISRFEFSSNQKRFIYIPSLDPSGGRQVDEGPDFVRLRVHEDGSDLNTEELKKSRCLSEGNTSKKFPKYCFEP